MKKIVSFTVGYKDTSQLNRIIIYSSIAQRIKKTFDKTWDAEPYVIVSSKGVEARPIDMPEGLQ